MNNLAATLYALGDLAGARELLQQADTYRRVLGPEHPDARTAAENLAGVQRALGEAAQEADPPP